ncbi:MAG: hypothetical protein HY899_01395 [Deltaproteobacteria bacterium]|nr:hypothetical protein [Deltaproteobacteria bacterium]
MADLVNAIRLPDRSRIENLAAGEQVSVSDRHLGTRTLVGETVPTSLSAQIGTGLVDLERLGEQRAVCENGAGRECAQNDAEDRRSASASATRAEGFV